MRVVVRYQDGQDVWYSGSQSVLGVIAEELAVASELMPGYVTGLVISRPSTGEVLVDWSK